MYEYKFAQIMLDGTFIAKPDSDYRKLINENAKEGWRFVQIFEPIFSAPNLDLPDYFDLIFEREIKQP